MAFFFIMYHLLMDIWVVSTFLPTMSNAAMNIGMQVFI